MIHTEKLQKQFGDKVAVAGLDLAVEAGEFFCFLGPNGAGKTTTIKMLTGLLRPTAGRALIGGFDIQTQPLLAKGLTGYIPDHPFLYDRLTGREFLAFIAGLYRLPKARWQPLAEELLEVFELSAAADSLVHGYSHGMRQKLSFASTFLHEPKLVVVDEPWVGLDPKNIHRVKHFLRQRVDEGLTVFMSTHSLSLAEELADRVGIIHQGELLHVGRVSEIKALAQEAEAHRETGSLEQAFLQLTRDNEA
ncbi:MAG: ABC transporter ATP-binding protein [Deltaproteobacteria bacterium]|nr:ABC transporter ATP-binding protein [Deltaproteobacteria bacterium]